MFDAAKFRHLEWRGGDAGKCASCIIAGASIACASAGSISVGEATAAKPGKSSVLSLINKHFEMLRRLLMDQDHLTGWVLGGVVAVVSTLAGVVMHLYRLTQTQNSREIQELQKAVNECESDRKNLRDGHEQIRQECTDLQIRIAKLEKQNGNGSH